MSLRFRLVAAAVAIVITTACVTAGLFDFFAPGHGENASLKSLAFPTFMASMTCGAIAALLGLWLAQSIARQFREVAEFAEATFDDIQAATIVLGGNGQAARVHAAVASLHISRANLIAAIRSADERLTQIEADTRAALRHEETAVRAFGGSATEIAAAVAEISATSEQLFASTGAVMKHAREAASVADGGREGLAQMTDSIRHLDEAMNAFSRKLATISQRAAGITAVVTTIAKVADQTNLLSVNATIEAEKAGPAGRGFRIVAQEIRRLADQTGQSTKDIERLVRDMQAAVAGGTMEMDRFRNEVSSRLGEVASVSEQLGHIIGPVHAVTDSLEQVHEGMAAQSEGARQIRSAMEALRGDAAESAASLEAFTAAIDDIRATATELQAAAEAISDRTAV